MGNAENYFPRIQGQHYAYLLRQLQWIRDGRRKNAGSVLLAHIKEMNDVTLGYIEDYISRIKVMFIENTTKEKSLKKL